LANLDRLFSAFARWTAHHAGRASTFILAVAVVAAWAATGPLFGFSDTWQLVINTGTTIVTFLMVFLIQNTQNRDTEALQLKLYELIRASAGARNRLLELEDLDEEELDRLKAGYAKLAAERPGAARQLREALRAIGGAAEAGKPEGAGPRPSRGGRARPAPRRRKR
jgi:low affinity Fe/Cu permease